MAIARPGAARRAAAPPRGAAWRHRVFPRGLPPPPPLPPKKRPEVAQGCARGAGSRRGLTEHFFGELDVGPRSSEHIERIGRVWRCPHWLLQSSICRAALQSAVGVSWVGVPHAVGRGATSPPIQWAAKNVVTQLGALTQLGSREKKKKKKWFSSAELSRPLPPMNSFWLDTPAREVALLARRARSTSEAPRAAPQIVRPSFSREKMRLSGAASSGESQSSERIERVPKHSSRPVAAPRVPTSQQPACKQWLRRARSAARPRPPTDRARRSRRACAAARCTTAGRRASARTGRAATGTNSATAVSLPAILRARPGPRRAHACACARARVCKNRRMDRRISTFQGRVPPPACAPGDRAAGDVVGLGGTRRGILMCRSAARRRAAAALTPP